MAVDAGVDAHAHGAPDRLCDLALVDGTERRVVGVLDVAHGRREVGDEGEVLFARLASYFHSIPTLADDSVPRREGTMEGWE